MQAAAVTPERQGISASPSAERARWRVRTVLLPILAVATAVRLVVLWGARDLPLTIVDEQHYAEIAGNIAAGEGFSQWGAPTSMRPPLYPALIAGVWAVSGSRDLQVVRSVQIAFGVLTTVAVFALARQLYDERTAIVAAGISALYPMLVVSGALLLTEVVFTALLTLFLLAMATLLQRHSPFTAIATGVLLGLAALTRSVMWPFIGVAILMLLAWSAGRLRQRFGTALMVILGYLVVITPWAYRNTRLQGTFTVVDTMGGMNLLMGNYEYTDEDRMWATVDLAGGPLSWARDLPERAPDGSAWTDGKKEKWAQRQALIFMASHPWTTIRRAALKFADFWGLERELFGGVARGRFALPPAFLLLTVVVVTASWVAVALLGVCGAILAVPSDRRIQAATLSVVLFICAVHTIVFAHSRYHLPLIPVLGIYAAAAVTQRTWSRLTFAHWPGRLAIGLVAVLAVIWAREVLVRDAGRIRALLEMLV